MCFWFMKVKPRGESQVDPYDGRFYRLYRGFLEGALRLRIVVLGVVAGFMALAGFAFQFVVQEFFPASDRIQFLVYLDMPAGTHVTETARVVEELGDWLGDEAINQSRGQRHDCLRGRRRTALLLVPIAHRPRPHLGFMIVNTHSSESIPEMVGRVRQRLLDQVPDVRGRVMAMWLGASETGLVEVRISGPDADILVEKAEHLLAGLRSIPGTVDVRHDWENRGVKIRVDVDQARAPRRPHLRGSRQFIKRVYRRRGGNRLPGGRPGYPDHFTRA